MVTRIRPWPWRVTRLAVLPPFSLPGGVEPLADADGDGVHAVGLQGLGGWVVDEADAGRPELLNLVRSLGGRRDLPACLLPAARLVASVLLEDGQGGQAGQDGVFADVQVPGPGGVGAGGAGVAVAAAVGGLAVGPGGFQPPPADPAAQQPG